jgi:hypothetical protein
MQVELSCEHPYAPGQTPKTDFRNSALFSRVRRCCETLFRYKQHGLCHAPYIHVFHEYSCIIFACCFGLLLHACMARLQLRTKNAQRHLASKYQNSQAPNTLLVTLLFQFISLCNGRSILENETKNQPMSGASVVNKQQRQIIKGFRLNDMTFVSITQRITKQVCQKFDTSTATR